MNVVLLLWRTRLQSSWRAAVVLVVLIGLGGAVTLAVAAGARRTASANDAILEAANASDVATFQIPGDLDTMADVLRSVPDVSGVDLWVGLRGRPQGVDPASIAATFGFWSERPTIDRPTVTSGRLPAAATEGLLNEAAAKRSGLKVGSKLQLSLADPAFSDFETVEVDIVGIGLFPHEVLQDELGGTSGIWLSRAFTELHLDRVHYASGRLTLASGDDAALAPILARVTANEAVVDERRDDDRSRVQEALRPLSWALAGLAALAGGATVVVAAQALGRTLRRRPLDDRSLASMGCTTRQLVAADLAYTAAVAGCGLLVAVALAAAASPLFPIGPPRRVDAIGGIDIDLVALGAGSLALGAVIMALVGASSWRRRNMPGITTPGRAPGPLGARPASSTGLRLVTGRRSTVSTVTGMSVGLAAVITTITFTASLEHLVSDQALMGMGWDLIGREGYTAIDLPQVRAVAEGEPPVQRLSGLGYLDGELNGVKTPLATIRSVVGDPWPPIVAGRAPASTFEILVGKATLRALGLHIGDEVDVSLSKIMTESAAPMVSRRFRVVGSAVTPAVGLIGWESPRLDVGVALPVGAAAGRWLWTAFAERIGVVVEPVVPLLLLAATALLSIVAVQGTALIPAAIARRTPPGRTLHGE